MIDAQEVFKDRFVCAVGGPAIGGGDGGIKPGVARCLPVLVAGRAEEGKPGASGEVCTQFGATQDRPAFGRAALGAGFVKRFASAHRQVKVIQNPRRPGR